MSKAAKQDTVLVGRLRQAYWTPFVRKLARKASLSYAVRSDFLDEEARAALTPKEKDRYDGGRVRFFYEKLRRGEALNPVEIDMHADFYSLTALPSWSGPFLVDGHHRFAAHILARKRRIPATFGGLVSVLEWLRGDVRRIPPEVL